MRQRQMATIEISAIAELVTSRSGTSSLGSNLSSDIVLVK